MRRPTRSRPLPLIPSLARLPTALAPARPDQCRHARTRRYGAALLALALLHAGPGARADGGLSDPVSLLRSTGQVRGLEVVASASSAQRLRLRWGARGTSVDVIFSSEAVTAAQAQQVRRVTVAAPAPSGRPPTAQQRQALDEVARTLAAGCLNRAPRDLGPGSDLSRGESPWVQVTLTLWGDTPRCRMPSAR